MMERLAADITDEEGTPLTANPLADRLDAYGDWRDRLVADINAYQSWLAQEGLSDAEDELRIFELLDSVKRDKLSVAMVAEFSRGKTELINAIFFSDYNRRLLPSTPGRTTMCPTEIQYEKELDPCIMLLPIETRKTALTINEYKHDLVHWSTLPLNTESADDMADTLREIIKTKKVAVADARSLGLSHPDDIFADESVNKNDKVDIPVWRHAIINYPHPLLKKGLSILDTPGLNALGTEPELTLSMLPNAHAVMFVLAADTGVTRTDLEVWNSHVRVATRNHVAGRIAVLNKIDTLWDEIEADETISKSINRQVEETARVLNVKKQSVFPVSAQKGLLAKIKDDPTLLRRSRLNDLEDKISSDVLAAKHALLREKIISEIGGMIQATAALIESRLDSTSAELEQIQSLRGKSASVLSEMTNRLREQKAHYEQEVSNFDVTRRMLSDQIKILLSHMSLKSLDKLISDTRYSMQGSWTTQGLRKGMEVFFHGTTKRMERVNRDTKKVKDLVDSVYERFHKEHGLARVRPASFSVLPYRSEFKRLNIEAETFRNSPVMVMTEQHFVIKKFFITLGSRARDTFNDCNRATKSWARSILTPIYTQIREHKVMIERRIANLEKIKNNHVNLDQHISSLEQSVANLKKQQEMTRRMLARLHQGLPRGH